MKRIIASLTLITLMAGTTAPLHAWSWTYGWNKFKKRALYSTLAGAVLAGFGIWAMINNPHDSRAAQIDSELGHIEYTSSNHGYVGSYKTFTTDNRHIIPNRFGHGTYRTTETTIEDPVTRAQKQHADTRKSIANLSGLLTADEFNQLSQAKQHYDQMILNNNDVTTQGIALGALNQVISNIRTAHPTNNGDTLLAGSAIVLGGYGVIEGICEFIRGAQGAE